MNFLYELWSVGLLVQQIYWPVLGMECFGVLANHTYGQQNEQERPHDMSLFYCAVISHEMRIHMMNFTEQLAHMPGVSHTHTHRDIRGSDFN
jgi:hypothetical protein